MPRDRVRVPLESGPKIDINALRLRGNACLITVWSWTGLRVSIETKTDEQFGVMRLAFDGREQSLALVSDPRYFGGRQWYVRCPETGRRVSTLWKPPGSSVFASRHSWRNVAYHTQYQDRAGRAWAAKRRVARRLGNRDPNDYDLPARSPGMRWRTYEKLVSRYYAAELILDDECGLALHRLLRAGGYGAL